MKIFIIVWMIIGFLSCVLVNATYIRHCNTPMQPLTVALGTALGPFLMLTYITIEMLDPVNEGSETKCK